jgi:biopolymer transport protein ExbD
METYLFKFSACLAIFWLVYILFLERQTMHRFKRFYLLASAALALTIPLLTVTQYIEPIASSFEVSPVFIPIASSFIEIPQEKAPFMELETVLWIIYGLGVLLFSIRFAVNLFRMYRRILDNKNLSKLPFIYVLLEECRIPHSFFKYLFFDRLTYESNSIPSEVKLHEETHAKQLHSLDIIVIELLQIVFWFHPLLYILKHHIKLNHEFLADQAVLEEGIDTKTYQNILLQFSSNTDEYQLSSAINYSSIKKRFTVMKTQTSKTRIWLSSLLLLPVIAILFYSFAEKEYVEKENTEIIQEIKTELEKANDLQLIYTDGATEAMMQEYNDWIKESKKSSTLFIPLGKKERLAAIYDLMSEAQRSSVQPYTLLQEITPDLYSVTPSLPTAAQFESWKNETEFAIWLDGKHISNSELNNYKLNDIAHYVGSSVHSNAKSKKKPEPFQFNLYTKDGFNKFYKEAFVSGYEEICNEYSIAIHNYLKDPQTDNSELRILKAQADQFYNQFTKEDLDRYNLLSAPPVPAQKIPKTILSVLINQEEELIINNELGNLKSLEKVLQNLTVPKNYTIKFKADRQSSPEMTKSVLSLIKSYGLLLNSSQIERPKNQQKESYNPTFLEYIIEMELEDASFYLDDKKITPQEAKSIAKNNKGQQTEMLTQKDANGKYVVKLSSPKIKKIQEKATAKQVAAYNTWAKSINQQMAKAKANNDVNAYPIVKVKEVNTYKAIYDIMTVEQRKDTEAWPSFPPLPFPPAKKNDQNKKTINPIEITIKKDNSLILNGKPIAFKDLATSVGLMNNHLTIEERRTYAMASIIIEQNNSLDFSKKVQRELVKADIGSSSVGYGENNTKQGLPSKHYSPNSGLTIKKAKAQQEQALKDYNASLKKPKSDKNSPWAVQVEVNEVEFIEDSQIKSGPIEINGAIYYFSQNNGETTYYDQYGKVVDINKIPPPPPIPNDATPEQKAKIKKATDAYMKANPDKVYKAKGENSEIFDVVEIPEDLQGSVDINGETYYYTTSNGKTKYHNRYGTEVKMDNLPPPPPATMDSELMETIYETPNPKDKTLKQTLEDYKKWKSNNEPTLIKEEKKLTQNQTNKNPSFLEFIIEMEQKGATFYMDGKKISAEQAKTITKNNKGKNTEMITQKDADGKYIVKLSKRSKKTKLQRYLLPMVNGKALQTGVLPMTLNKLKKLELTLPNSKITSFKLKIPGIKTQQIKGNTISRETLLNLNSVKTGDAMSIFDIKDNKDSKISPVIIEITE